MVPANPASRLVPSLRGEVDERYVRPVDDADEEIFLLYSLARPEEGRRGLGYIEGSLDLLKIEVELNAGSNAKKAGADEICAGVLVENVSDNSEAEARPQRAKSKAKMAAPSSAVYAYLWQNQTDLRSARGDTGSVVWRSTIRLATLLLRQLADPRPALDESGDPIPHLLDLASSGAEQLRVIEVGAGTGALSSLLLPKLLSTRTDTHWVVTDQEAMLTLLNKNAQLARRRAGLPDSALSVAALDWIDVQQAVQSGRSSQVERVLKDVRDLLPAGEADLILAVDCIFNPFLIPPFLDTLASLCTPDRTTAFVLVELREQEMMYEFISSWVDHTLPADSSVVWKIFSLTEALLGHVGLQQGYACFAAYRTNRE